MAINVPEEFPEPDCFYYHYKHNPDGPVNNYAYWVHDFGFDTETGEARVIYYPLYPEAAVYGAGKRPDIRPLAMFMEAVEKDGVKVPRFAKVLDGSVIAQLREIKRKMYGN